jgi:signal transduction histidine kinase
VKESKLNLQGMSALDEQDNWVFVEPVVAAPFREGVRTSTLYAVEQLPSRLRLIEEERRRVAKELHDEILPLIARLSRYVQACKDESLCTLLNILHKTIADFRDLLSELHPVDLEELGLLSALQTICTRYARQKGFCIIFVPLGDEENVDVLNALCLFRAVQCILKNFCSSQNDILVVTCDLAESQSITFRCVDKRVESVDWLKPSDESEDSSFRAWCHAIEADVLSFDESLQIPVDLSIQFDPAPHASVDAYFFGGSSFPRAHFSEFTFAPSDNLNTPSPLDAALIVELERERITNQISDMVLPDFESLQNELCNLPMNSFCSNISQQLSAIEKGLQQLLIGSYPGFIVELCLADCIRNLVDNFAKTTGIKISFENQEDFSELSMPLESKFALYRITQEALNNIEKHSFASHAKVLLRFAEDRITLLVEDNGKGMNSERNSNGRGLRYLQDRASSIHATIAMSAAKTYESGTAVLVSISCG